MNANRAWDILLVVMGILATALGLANPQSAPLWVGVVLVLVGLLLLHSQRAPIGDALIALGGRVGGHPPVAPVTEEPLAPPYIPPSNRDIEVARAVGTLLRDSFDAARYDAEHGQSERRAAAEHAATTAVDAVEDIDDADIRQQVRDYRDQLFALPKGWKQQGGASDAQMAALQAAYDDAVAALGRLRRG